MTSIRGGTPPRNPGKKTSREENKLRRGQIRSYDLHFTQKRRPVRETSCFHIRHMGTENCLHSRRGQDKIQKGTSATMFPPAQSSEGSKKNVSSYLTEKTATQKGPPVTGHACPQTSKRKGHLTKKGVHGDQEGNSERDFRRKKSSREESHRMQRTNPKKKLDGEGGDVKN